MILWSHLRRRGLDGARWRRQHPVGPYVLDFFCSASSLAVEVDGLAHDAPHRTVRDLRRDAWLLDRGVRTLRLAAADVLDPDRREGALLAVADAARPRAP